MHDWKLHINKLTEAEIAFISPRLEAHRTLIQKYKYIKPNYEHVIEVGLAAFDRIREA